MKAELYKVYTNSSHIQMPVTIFYYPPRFQILTITTVNITAI